MYNFKNFLILDDFVNDYDYSQNSYEIYKSRPSNVYKGGVGLNITGNSRLPFFETLIDTINQSDKISKFGKLERIVEKVFIKSDYTSDFKSSIHLDDTASDLLKGFTFSYHFIGEENAGGTVWYNDLNGSKILHKIPFKPNRLVIFPAHIPHSGYANLGFKDNSLRIILTLFTLTATKQVSSKALNSKHKFE